MDKTTLIARNATIDQIVKLIKETAKQASRRPFTVNAAETINNAKDLHDFVYSLAVYREDPTGKQLIRTPERLKADGIGNCVDYTTAVSAILLAKGIPHKYRVTGYNGKGYSHIYPMIKNRSIDIVAGQLQDGTESKYDRSKPVYNYQEPYTLKKDYKVMPDVYILQGYTPKSVNDLFNTVQKEFDTSGSKCDNVYGTITGGSIRKAWNLVNSYIDSVVTSDAKKVDNYILSTGIKPDNDPVQFQRFLNTINLPLTTSEIANLKSKFLAEAESINAGTLCNKSNRIIAAKKFVNKRFANYVPNDDRFYHYLVMQNTKEYKGRYNYLLLSQTGSALAASMGVSNLFPFGQTQQTQPIEQPTVTTAGFGTTAILLAGGLLLTYFATTKSKK